MRRRFFYDAKFRAEASEDGQRTVSGYAALFGVLSSEIWPNVRERIAPGAFTDALKTSDVHALYNHDYNKILGRAKPGTLKLKEDEMGLQFNVSLPSQTDPINLVELMERGDVDQCSFAFTVDFDDIDREEQTDGSIVETVKRVKELFDVSVVPRGAYAQTWSVVRSHLIDVPSYEQRSMIDKLLISRELSPADIERNMERINSIEARNLPEGHPSKGSQTAERSEGHPSKENLIVKSELAKLHLMSYEF